MKHIQKLYLIKVAGVTGVADALARNNELMNAGRKEHRDNANVVTNDIYSEPINGSFQMDRIAKTNEILLGGQPSFIARNVNSEFKGTPATANTFVQGMLNGEAPYKDGSLGVIDPNSHKYTTQKPSFGSSVIDGIKQGFDPFNMTGAGAALRRPKAPKITTPSKSQAVRNPYIQGMLTGQNNAADPLQAPGKLEYGTNGVDALNVSKPRSGIPTPIQPR